MKKRHRRSFDTSLIAAAVELHPPPNHGRHCDAPAGAGSIHNRVTNGRVPEGFLLVNCGRCGRPLLVRLEDVMISRTIDCAVAAATRRQSSSGCSGNARRRNVARSRSDPTPYPRQ